MGHRSSLTIGSARKAAKATSKRLKAAAKASPDNRLTRACGYCGTEYAYHAKRIRPKGTHACCPSHEVAQHKGYTYQDPKATATCACGATMPKYQRHGGGGERMYCDECRALNIGQAEWARRNPDKLRAHGLARMERDRAEREAAWLEEGASCPIPLTHPIRIEEKRARGRADYRYRYHVLGLKESYYRSAYARRAKMKSNGPIDNIDRIAVFERDDYRCRICKTRTSIDVPATHPKRAILGHINALAAGGTHTWDNVCCLCYPCNAADGVNRMPIQTRMA